MSRSLTVSEQRRHKNLHASKVQALLDAGSGKCYLRNSSVAECTADALRHFDGERYQLYAWCIMPNHVHVVFRMLSDHGLEDILHTWKSFSAKMANQILGRAGQFCQREYFDHSIRDRLQFDRAVRYVIENPTKARLNDWPWVWPGV
jgi:REP element-mobilizing transposase RayT